jgi:hypothetical protein
VKPDNDCFVFKFGPNEFYLCMAHKPHEDNCPHILNYYPEHSLCYHPDRHEIPKGIRSELKKHEA